MTLARQILITLALIVVAMFAINRYALGFEGEYPERYERPERKPQVRAFVQRHKQPSRVITKAVVTPTKPEPRCKPHMSALGDAARSLEAAKLEAQKAIKSQIQFELGNRYMDIDAASALEYQCAPAAPPFAGGRIENAVGKMLPIQTYVCKITIAPCEATVQREYPGK